MFDFGLGLLIVAGLSSIGRGQASALERVPKGETIRYDIKKLRVTVGEATLIYHGLVEVNNRQALSVTFTAQGFKFFDEEQIYLDPVTFHPLLIKRSLDIFGKKESIIERYDTRQGRVQITKRSKGKVEEQVIEGYQRFDNIYGYIYRQRFNGRFSAEDTYDLHLPTLDVRFKVMDTKSLEVNDQEYEVFYIASVPKKYRVWFDKGPNRIPLKIDGVLGWGKMSMVFRAHGM